MSSQTTQIDPARGSTASPASNGDPAEKPRRRRRGCGGLFFLFILVGGIGWGAFLGVFVWLVDNSTDTLKELDNFRPKVGSRIYSADGQLLGEFSAEQRHFMRLNEIPLIVQKAFIATEDDTFYEHRGVRLEALVNSVLYKLRTGKMRGGSTITMQVARNVAEWNAAQEAEAAQTDTKSEAASTDSAETPEPGVKGRIKSLVRGRVDREVTYTRKLREMIVALQIERRYTKDEILEIYLNGVYLGLSANGVQAASQQYFGKDCAALTLGEAATLAGVTRSPENNPLMHPDASLERRNIVLDQMLGNNLISKEQYDAARAESLEASVVTREERARLRAEGKGVWAPNKFTAPYFAEEVRQFIVDKQGTYEVFNEGLQIRTTLDMRLQRAAEESLFGALDEFDSKKREALKKEGKESDFVPVTGALLCIDNRPQYKGFIRAMVGGRDFEKEKYNTTTQAKRQPGSSIKPYVWTAAIASGMTPSTIEVDAPYRIVNQWGQVWEPKNFGSSYLGPITLRTALQKSVNIVSVKLVERVTMPVVRSYMQRAGVKTPIEDEVALTISLGSPAITVLDQCAAYSTFANGGVRYDPIMIADITNRDGLSVYDYHNTPAARDHEQAIPANVAYVMTYLMQGVCRYGTAANTQAAWDKAQPGRPRAGKTGTSNRACDTWFCGFTPDFTCVVWIGYRDNRPLGHGEGFTGGAFGESGLDQFHDQGRGWPSGAGLRRSEGRGVPQRGSEVGLGGRRVPRGFRGRDRATQRFAIIRRATRRGWTWRARAGSVRRATTGYRSQ